jgi:hypothetical protein
LETLRPRGLFKRFSFDRKVNRLQANYTAIHKV